MQTDTPSQSGYCKVFSNYQFVLVFVSYLICSFGDWLNYIAAIKLLEEISPSSLQATYVSLFMVIRLVPPLILAPFTGSIADAYEKKVVMGVTNLASAVVVCGFLLVKSFSVTWLFFLIVFLQQMLFAQYDPTRRALIPAVVSAEELKFATTADAYAWSIMMAVGAASGGGILATFGLDVNFFVDAGTFVVSAVLILLTKPVSSHRELTQKEDMPGIYLVGANILDGARYIARKEQRSLLIVLFVKASAALSWGLAELLEVEYSEMSSMHAFGGSATTLGLTYASTGLGCVIGPIAFGALQCGEPKSALKRTLVYAFGLSFVSALVLWMSESASLMLVSSFLRACASSVIWIYSTLLVQQKADDQFFGRVFATEMCFFTAAKGAGLLLGAALNDLADLSSRKCAFVMAAMSLAVFFFWAAIFMPMKIFRSKGDEEDEATTKKPGEKTPLMPHSAQVEPKNGPLPTLDEELTLTI